MAVRALIRSSTLGTNAKEPLLEAQKRLTQMQINSANANLKEDLSALSDFVEARQNPEKYLHQMLDTSPVSINNLGEITFMIDSIMDNASQQQNSGGSTGQP